MATKTFASTGDLGEKTITFAELGRGAYAFTAEGDPNTGVIVGDDAVMVLDTQATPKMAQKVIDEIRTVTDKPIRYIVLTHYHAVRVLGAAAYGAENIIASQRTHELIVERGQQDWESEFGRFPRLFEGHESIKGLTWPNIVFDGKLTVDLGNQRVEIWNPGRGHTQGDTIAWLPDQKILYSGDLVEFGATPYTGDAHLQDWPETLQRLRALKPEKLVPGRGGRAHVRCRLRDRHGRDPGIPDRPVPNRARGRGKRDGPEGHLRPVQAAHGPEIWSLGHLRTLHAVRCRPRCGRSQGAGSSEHLDGGT